MYGIFLVLKFYRIRVSKCLAVEKVVYFVNQGCLLLMVLKFNNYNDYLTAIQFEFSDSWLRWDVLRSRSTSCMFKPQKNYSARMNFVESAFNMHCSDSQNLYSATLLFLQFYRQFGTIYLILLRCKLQEQKEVVHQAWVKPRPPNNNALTPKPPRNSTHLQLVEKLGRVV